MKKLLVGICGFGALVLGSSQPAEAALFVTLTVGSSSTTCDNGTAAGVAACTAGGFSTSLNSNLIVFVGSFGGYNFSLLGVTANVPGTPLTAQVTDSKTAVTNQSATSNLVVDFGAYNFTLPPTSLNPLVFSSSQTANWNTSVNTDSSAFSAWANASNTTSATGTLAATPTITSPGGTTGGFGSESPDVLFTRLATPYSLIGQEIIQLAQGSNGSFTATMTLNAVPEPATLLLLGSGLLGLAARARRRK